MSGVKTRPACPEVPKGAESKEAEGSSSRASVLTGDVIIPRTPRDGSWAAIFVRIPPF